jgi:hypothetical protein
MVLTAPAFAGSTVTSPANGSTVGTNVPFAATGTTNCAEGVAAMAVWVNNIEKYSVDGAKLSVTIVLPAGTYNAVVQQWDNCGNTATVPLAITVAAGNAISQIQGMGGWNQWGELPPAYDICSSDPCGGVWWSAYQHLTSNSLSGNMTQFNIGGSTPYSDVLWSNPVMGQGSASLPDTARTVIPNIHNFIYDAYVFVTNPSVTEALEFDVNMYLNGAGMEWGTQCDHLADGQWDVWNNVDAKWVPSGVPCNLVYGWNHVTVQVQRESNNDLVYQTISLNGTTYTLNATVAPFAVPSGWYGVTVNYQMDGDYKQSPNTTYLDKFNLTYW